MAIVKTSYTNSFKTIWPELTKDYLRQRTSGGERAILYNHFGEALDKHKDIKKDFGNTTPMSIPSLRIQLQMMENGIWTVYRKIILSPDPKTEMSQQEMKWYTRNVMAEYQCAKDRYPSYVFACHDHNGIAHAHIVAYGSRDDLFMGKEDWQLLKKIADKKEKTVFLENQCSRTIEPVSKSNKDKLNQIWKFLENLPFYDFERLVGKLFEKMGYKVISTPPSGDSGIDLFVERDGGRSVVQCKKHKNFIGSPDLQRFYGCIMDQHANVGILVSSSGFTEQSRNFAEGKPIELIDGIKLDQLLKEYTGQGIIEQEEIEEAWLNL